jgi:hypothetical protein
MNVKINFFLLSCAFFIMHPLMASEDKAEAEVQLVQTHGSQSMNVDEPLSLREQKEEKKSVFTRKYCLGLVGVIVGLAILETVAHTTSWLGSNTSHNSNNATAIVHPPHVNSMVRCLSQNKIEQRKCFNPKIKFFKKEPQNKGDSFRLYQAPARRTSKRSMPR